MPKPKFIYVPQGCYAEIISSTPENVLGLITSGIHSCCSIIITNLNDRHKYIALCHADDKTDLEDLEYGLPSLIHKACPYGNFTNLVIYVGEEEDLPRNDLTPIYLNQIKRILKKFKVSEDVYLNLESKLRAQTHDEIYVISVSREICKISERHHEKNVIEDELGEIDIDMIQLKYEGEDTFPLESSIIHGRSYAAKEYTYNFPEAQSKKFPPICVFDGSSNLFLPLSEIERSCCLYGISWERIINDATSSYAGSESYSSDFESETSEIKEDLTFQAKQQEILFNRLLAPEGLRALDVGGGGNCFFHAIAHQLGIAGHNPMAFEELRQLAINYMLNHPQEFTGFTEEALDDYIAIMSQNGGWADNSIMQALVNELNIRIHIYQLDGSIIILEPITNIEIPAGVVSIAYTGAHYLSIESIPSLETGRDNSL